MSNNRLKYTPGRAANPAQNAGYGAQSYKAQTASNAAHAADPSNPPPEGKDNAIFIARYGRPIQAIPAAGYSPGRPVVATPVYSPPRTVTINPHQKPANRGRQIVFSSPDQPSISPGRQVRNRILPNPNPPMLVETNIHQSPVRKVTTPGNTTVTVPHTQVDNVFIQAPNNPPPVTYSPVRAPPVLVQSIDPAQSYSPGYSPPRKTVIVDPARRGNYSPMKMMGQNQPEAHFRTVSNPVYPDDQWTTKFGRAPEVVTSKRGGPYGSFTKTHYSPGKRVTVHTNAFGTSTSETYY